MFKCDVSVWFAVPVIAFLTVAMVSLCSLAPSALDSKQARIYAADDYTPLTVSKAIRECAAAQAQARAETLVNNYNTHRLAIRAMDIQLQLMERKNIISEEQRKEMGSALTSWGQGADAFLREYEQINLLAEKVYAQGIVDSDRELDAAKKRQLEELDRAIMQCGDLTEALTW